MLTGSYADYEYYLYTYVAFSGDRFYTIVVEGDKSAVEDIVLKVENQEFDSWCDKVIAALE